MNRYNDLSLNNIVEFVEGVGMVEEFWVPIKGYEGIYDISCFGRVKSLARIDYNSRGILLRQEKVLKQYLVKEYLRVAISKSRLRKNKLVHVLVSLAFHENPENKPQVNHGDANKLNNSKWNLEWNTRSENMQHAFRSGLMKIKKGEDSNFAVLYEYQIIQIFNSSLSNKKLAVEYGISSNHVMQIRSGARWSHLTGKKFERKKYKMSQDLEKQIRDSVGPQKEVMRKFGISRSLLYKIKSGRSWRDIDSPKRLSEGQ